MTTQTAQNIRYATPAQIKFYRSLTEELVRNMPNMSEASKEANRQMWRNCKNWSRREISDGIGVMQRAVLTSRELKPAVRVDVAEGFYINTKNGSAVKVLTAVHGSDNLYAKTLTKGTWEKTTGLVSYMSKNPAQFTKMTAEQAGEFGKLYGMCIRCGRDLTDEESIGRGMGPICYSKF